MTPETVRLQNAAFAKWFRGSVIRDEAGEPLRVFHGTSAIFDRFRPGEDGMVFFTRCSNIANQYAQACADAPNARPRIIHAFLRIHRPRTLSAFEWLMGVDKQELLVGDAQWHRARGWDGIVIKADPEHPDPLFHADSYAVFDAKQIRTV